MGIDTHVYCVYGVKTEWDDDFHQAQDEYETALIKEHGYDKWRSGKIPDDPMIEVTSDGMGGEYMVFGPQLYDSGNWRWGELTQETQVELDGDTLKRMRDEYIETFRKVYPDHVHLVDRPWKLINFVHYS